MNLFSISPVDKKQVSQIYINIRAISQSNFRPTNHNQQINKPQINKYKVIKVIETDFQIDFYTTK